MKSEAFQRRRKSVDCSAQEARHPFCLVVAPQDIESVKGVDKDKG